MTQKMTIVTMKTATGARAKGRATKRVMEVERVMEMGMEAERVMGMAEMRSKM